MRKGVSTLETFNTLLKEYQERPSSKYNLHHQKISEKTPLECISNDNASESNNKKSSDSKNRLDANNISSKGRKMSSSRESDAYEDDFLDISHNDHEMKSPISASSPYKSLIKPMHHDVNKFDFKSYIEKQMTQQVGNAISVFDHLRDNIPQAKVLHERLTYTKPFQIQLSHMVSLESIGIGIIVNPRFSCHDSVGALTLKLSYNSHHDANESIDIILQASASSKVPDKYSLTLSPQTLSSYHDRHIPGWDGVVPTYLPASTCNCELVAGSAGYHYNNADTYPLSMLIFPVLSEDDVFNVLKKSMESYHLKSLIHVRVMGGMPIVNLAALQGETKVVTTILTKGGNANYRSPMTMNTALHEAIYGHHRKIVSLLLDLGGDQLLADHKGNLPLHLAAEYEYVDIVRMLLHESKGTTAVFMENQAGAKPVDLAKSTYIKQIIREKMDSIKPKVKPILKHKDTKTQTTIKKKVRHYNH